jgi:hypothetical protein
MSNALTNPSFETAAAWSFNAYAGRNTDEANTGGYAGWLIVQPSGGIGWDTGQITQADFPTRSGQDYRVSLFFNADLRADTTLRVLIDPDGNGYQAFTDLAVFGSGWTEWHAGMFAGQAGTASIRIQAVDNTQNALWYVDDVVVTEMAITKTITDAVKADLDDISQANGFALDVARVTTDDDDIYKVPTPGIIWRPAGSGDSEKVSMGGKNATVQRYALELAARSIDDLHNLLDDVRNAVERSVADGGNTIATAGILKVMVGEWTGYEYADNRWVMACMIDVTYDYLAGSA